MSSFGSWQAVAACGSWQAVAACGSWQSVAVGPGGAAWSDSALVEAHATAGVVSLWAGPVSRTGHGPDAVDGNSVVSHMRALRSGARRSGLGGVSVYLEPSRVSAPCGVVTGRL